MLHKQKYVVNTVNTILFMVEAIQYGCLNVTMTMTITTSIRILGDLIKGK